MSRTASSGSPDLVSGRSIKGGKKAVNQKEDVSTITTTVDLQQSASTRASEPASSR